MKFSRKVGNWPPNKKLNFGGDPDHRLDTGIVFRIRHYWEIRKVVNGHSFILIRQKAAMVRCAMAEVCTVPIFLVMSVATIAREFEVRFNSKPENLVPVIGKFNAKIFRTTFFFSKTFAIYYSGRQAVHKNLNRMAQHYSQANGRPSSRLIRLISVLSEARRRQQIKPSIC